MDYRISALQTLTKQLIPNNDTQNGFTLFLITLLSSTPMAPSWIVGQQDLDG
jgi:hypothetical protein